MDTAERGRKSRIWRGVGICSTWHLFSSRAGTRTNVKLKKKGCVSGSAEVLMRRCWCSIKVPEVEKYVKLMRLLKNKEKKKKMRHGSNPGFSSWLPVKSKGVFISCCLPSAFSKEMMWMLGFSPYYCKLTAKLFFTLQWKVPWGECCVLALYK